VNDDAPSRLRFPIFIVLAALMLLGPIYGHFFATGSASYLGWRMYSRSSTGFCAVRYSEVDARGHSTTVDRVRALGYAGRAVPKDLWRVPNLRAARQHGRKMCKRVGGKPDLRLEARCADPAGWIVAATGVVPLCP
jgi:hypothetical protein